METNFCSMPSIQLICQKSEFKRQFKSKFKTLYNIFTSESLKDGLRNVSKMDIDLLIIEVLPQKYKTYAWIDSILRQKNINTGEIGIIFMMDPENMENIGIQKLLAMKKKFHFFWFNALAFEKNKSLYTSFELFLKNTLQEIETLRLNFILSNRLVMQNQISTNDPLHILETALDEFRDDPPMSFLPQNNTNVNFSSDLQKAIRKWPLILLRGNEGLEQENLAKYIHTSNNSASPFLSIDFMDIPEYYHDTVLFGLKQKNLPGFKYLNNSLFETVKKGTLLIKNIEQLKWETQNELFRAIQNSSYMREDTKVNIKCKFIFSSTADLEKYVEKGLLRQNLYSHLAVYSLNIPNLQQRRKDIPLIIENYIRWFETRYHKKISLTEEARLQIMKNPYPGQFDQLYKYLFRVFSLCEGQITPATLSLIEKDIPQKIDGVHDKKSENKIAESSSLSLKKTQTSFVRETIADSSQYMITSLLELKQMDYSLVEIEREYIKQVLARNYNNIAVTARILGITRKTLYDKLKKYKIKNPVKMTG